MIFSKRIKTGRRFFGGLFLYTGVPIRKFHAPVHDHVLAAGEPDRPMGLLLIAGERVNIFSLIDVIMLMGLVTKNAILLVDYTITLRHRGMERNEALLKAGPVRLRPIIMTTAAMIFGMLPTALKIGEGAEQRAPMAIAVIGGLVTSTMLALVVVPVVHTIVDDIENYFKKERGKA